MILSVGATLFPRRTSVDPVCRGVIWVKLLLLLLLRLSAGAGAVAAGGGLLGAAGGRLLSGLRQESAARSGRRRLPLSGAGACRGGRSRSWPRAAAGEPWTRRWRTRWILVQSYRRKNRNSLPHLMAWRSHCDPPGRIYSRKLLRFHGLLRVISAIHFLINERQGV